MPEGLKIQVGADVQQAVKGLKQLENQTTATFSKVNSIITPAVNKSAASLVKYSQSSNTATQATINLSRVIQDAPFGFIGIANNLNPLLESFQRLRKESGSTGAALKSLVGSLMGAGGIGLALSAVSSLLLVFSLNSRGAKKETEELKKETDVAAEKQKEFQTAVDSAAQSLLTQAKNLKDIRNILESTTASTEELTAATINQGVARLIFDQKNSELQKILSAEIEKQFLLRSRIGGLKAPELIFDPQLERLKQFNKSLGALGQSDQGLTKMITRIEELNQVIGGSKGSLNFLNSITGDLQKFFSGFVAKPDKLTVSPKSIEVDPRPALGSIQIELPTVFDILAEDTRSRFKRQLDELSSKVQLRLPVTLDLSKPGKAFQNLQNSNASVLAAMRKLGEDTAAAFNNALQSGLTNGLAGIGEGLGNALAGGDIGDAFKAFASSIGEALQAMGKQIIGIGIAALLAKEALKTLFSNPVTAILAGTALIAAGAALKSALSGGIKGFAAGGLVTGPQLALIGEGSGTSRANPEVVAPLDKLKGMLTGMGGGSQVVVMRTIVRGNNLALVQARTSRSQKRTTGR